jgi:transcriptional regulator with XRE-family HTH domain
MSCTCTKGDRALRGGVRLMARRVRAIGDRGGCRHMATGQARNSKPRKPATPNLVLRRIREQERHETRAQFAEAMTRIAQEIGEEVYPDAKYVERLETGTINWPHPPYRNILVKLCNRPIGDLGFTAPVLTLPGFTVTPDNHSGDATPVRVNVPLRDAILASGMEVSQLARKVGVDPKSAQRWITRGRIPRPSHRWKACQVLGRDESDLWPDASPDKEHPESNSGITPSKSQVVPRSEPLEFPDPLRPSFAADMVEAMKRRAFLMSAATAAGFGAVGAITAREAIRHEAALFLTGRSSTTDVEEWREIAAEYGESYPVAEPSEILKSLMADLYGIQTALQTNSGEPQQRELRSVGAMLSAFTAQTIGNLGNLSEARRWWRTARNAADESEDPYTVLWIRGREIVRAGYEHRPLPAILQLIDELEARITGRFPITAMPEFLAGKAQALALMGDPATNEAEETLNQLRDSFDALPLSARTGTNRVFSWGEERLRFTESLTYTYLGNYRKADRAQTAALALYPAEDLRSPAQIELQRALCLVGAGDVVSGVRHAQTVISGLPSMHRIRPVADLGHKVLRAIPAQKRDDAEAQEYGEYLNASFTVVPELTA